MSFYLKRWLLAGLLRAKGTRMEGDLREFSLAEILQFIALGSRTGVLEILSREGVHPISFTGGTITGLSADNWTLAAELRASGLVSGEVLTGLLVAGATTDELHSAVLTGGYMTAEEWTAFVARQVERLLYALFDVREGKFRFRQATEQPGAWLPVRITADRAVLEGTRWSETWARAADTIRSHQSRFVRAPSPPRQSLRINPTQWRVYVALGEPGSVFQVAARAVLTEVEVVKSIRRLLEQGLIHPDPEPA